jgi:hypothetical protein
LVSRVKRTIDSGFENRLTVGRKREEGAGENCIMRSFMMAHYLLYLLQELQ